MNRRHLLAAGLGLAAPTIAAPPAEAATTSARLAALEAQMRAIAAAARGQ